MRPTRVLVTLAIIAVVSSGAVAGAAAANNTDFSSAKEVTGGTYSGEEVPATGGAYYEIDLDASEQVTFDTDDATENLQLTLYDADQATVLRENDESFDPNAAVTYTADEAKTVYLKIETTSDVSATHTLSVTTTDLTDEFEPNDGFDEAAAVTDGTYDGLYVAGTELDYYAVSLNASEQVTFSTSGAERNLEMTLYDEDQATVLRENDESFDPNVAVTYTANEAKTVYLKLDSTSDRSTGYTLSVTTPDLTDEFEPNDGFDTAAAVSDGTYDGLYAAGAELDYYAVSLNASEQMTLSTSDAERNLKMTLYDADQATVLRENDESFNNDVAVTYTANEAKTVYLALDSTSDRSTGYTLSVTTPDLTDEYEPSNEIATSPLVGSGVYSGLQIAGTEVDFYAIPLNTTEAVTVSVEEPERNIQARLLAPDGSTVVREYDESFNKGLEFTQTVAQDGYYYLELDSTSDRSTPYTLRVTSNQTIDVPNIAPTVTVGPDQRVDALSTVTLTADALDRNRDDLTYEWTQTEGPAVSVPDGAPTSFQAPAVTENVTLTFTLTVTDEGGKTATGTVSVDVTALSAPVVPGGSGPATDTDGDGLYEDVNGDGSANIFDAIALYNARNSDAVSNNAELFNFDGAGGVDLFDAISLYNAIS